MPVLIAVTAAAVSWYILYRSKYGMILRGIGNNPTAIERSGWSYLTAKMTNYGLSAVMVILSGMTFTAVCLGADANSAASYCMLSIATVILGGCEMSGGVVEPVGVVVGGIAMSFITAPSHLHEGGLQLPDRGYRDYFDSGTGNQADYP